MGPLSYKEHGYTSLAKSFDFEKKPFSTKRPSSEAPEQFFQSFILEEALQILSSFEIRKPIYLHLILLSPPEDLLYKV